MRFAIHPVAGHLPGHMNVLLAKAKIPYDIVLNGEIDHDFPDTNVVLVVGATTSSIPARWTTVEPDLRHADSRSGKAKICIVMKRGMANGYADVDDPLFYKDKTQMLFVTPRR